MADALPPGLELMAPGPELAAVLSTVDRSRLDCADAVTLLRVRSRQVAYDEAQLLADAAEVGLLDWDTPVGVVDRRCEPDEFSKDRVAWALTCSLPAGQARLDLALDLLRRLPLVYAALAAGRIDLARARVFHDMLIEVDDAVAAAVVAKLIDKAAGWTCGKLRDRLRYHLHKADPGWVSRRYRHAVTRREVHAGTSPDGTAYMSGSGLPVDRTAAADDYVTRLARAAKASGDQRTLAQLRVDAYLDLLTGMTFGTKPSCDPVTAHADAEERAAHERLHAQWAARPEQRPSTVEHQPRDPAESERFIPAHLVHDPHDPREAPLGSARLSAECCLARDSFGRPNTTNPDLNAGGPTGQPSADHHTARGAGPDDRAGGQPPDHPSGDPRTGAAERASRTSTPTPPGPGSPPHHRSRTNRPPSGKGDPGIAVSVPDPPPDALECCRCGGVRVGDRRGTVTITMTLQTLTGVTNDPAVIPGWGPVLAEIARTVALDQDTTPSGEYALTDHHGQLLHCGPIRRRPYAQDQRFTRLRDLTCRAPNCRRPAAACDIDHRTAYASGGPSDHHNLELLCVNHRLKHEKHLTLHHCGNGAYEWRAPNGERWHVPADESALLTADDNP
jgi:hypothetical protein